MHKKGVHHIPEARLEAYAMNSLDEAELASVEEHLLYCETCQDRCGSVDRFVRAMTTASLRLEDERYQAPIRRQSWNWLPDWLRGPLPIWTGSLAFVALIVVVGLQWRHSPDSHAATPVTVELMAVRGNAGSSAPPGHPLNLRLDNRDLKKVPGYQLEIVDNAGSTVWTGTGSWSGNAITADVLQPLQTGTYYIRLLQEDKTSLREFQLDVR